jgi:hypothetical protein
MLLPIVWGVLGRFSNALIGATNETGILKIKYCPASFTFTAYILYKALFPSHVDWKAKASIRSKGKVRRQIASLPTTPYP